MDTVAVWHKLAPEVKLYNEYGPTETVVGCCVHEVLFGHESTTRVPIGRPISNTRLYVMNVDLELMPAGMVGELCIAGAGVALGYLGDRELTAERFPVDPYSQDGSEHLFRTGDLARILPNGEFDFLGRIDDQLKVHGYRVDPAEPTAVLRMHPYVSEAVVLGSRRETGDMRLIAYVSLAPDGQISPETLRSFVAARLPFFMVPDKVVVLTRLPLTKNAKVDISALRTVSQFDSEDAAFTIPATEVERAIAAIWSDLLGVRSPGMDENFFDLGGSSLQLIQMRRQIRERIGISLSIADMFRYSTIRLLVRRLNEGENASPTEEGEERGAHRRHVSTIIDSAAEVRRVTRDRTE